MADTSFRFGPDSDDNQLSPDDTDCLDIEEEEYDALNDETFGTLEDSTGIDDWEQQHEQFAELAENSKQTEGLENSINKLKLTESSYVFPSKNNSVWSYNAGQNGDIFGSSLSANSLQKSSRLLGAKSDVKVHTDDLLSLFNVSSTKFDPTVGLGNRVHKKICTVEELEKGLLQNRVKVLSPNIVPSAPPLHHVQSKMHPPFVQHPMQAPLGTGCLPPGLPPIGIPLPHMRHLPHMHHHNVPPGLVRLVPPAHFMQGAPTPPPGLIFPPHQQFPVNHPFNFPAPPRLGNVHNMHHNNKLNHHNNQYRLKMEENSLRHRNEYFAQKDEYSGLMSSREKQWLINIQLVQLNTGTPYFDDYYYTIFKERKSKNSKENQPPTDKGQWHNRRNNDRQENQNTLTPKVYTPLQFENSLGKLQCGSVTAPRKIIDMDIVTPDKDNENNSARDTKKIKQLLLELEAFYCYLLKAEDLKNPLYTSNMVKLCEIKQKQRLRELDLASTPEQKQEILRCLQQESAPLMENSNDYLTKVINGLFQEDKFSNFLSIRKGKMLLLRILPSLTSDYFLPQLCDLWNKVLLSIPVVGRKDTSGDQLFLRLHPHFKQFIRASDMNVILELVSNLLEVLSPENNRGTPISCQGKPPLSFIVSNRFGVSALATMLVRVENLIVENRASDKQQTDWFNFVVGWTETLLVPKLNLVTPIELLPSDIFNRHCSRTDNLTLERMKLLEKWISNGS